MRDFLIFYAKGDRAWARWIAWELEHAGYTTALLESDSTSISNRMVETERLLRDAYRIIVVLSPAVEFSEAERGVAYAVGSRSELNVLPVRVAEYKPSGVLAPLNYLDLVNLNEHEAEGELLRGIARERRKPSADPRFPAAGRAKPAFPLNLQRAALKEAERFFGAGMLEAAASGLHDVPPNSELRELYEKILKRRQAAESAIERAARASQSGDIELAARLLEEAANLDRGDSQIQKILDKLQKRADAYRRERQRRYDLDAAQQLLRQQRTTEAIDLLDRAAATYAQDSDLRTLISVAKKALREERRHGTLVRVFYGTDRKESRTDSALTFSGDRGDDGSLKLGVCDVIIPRSHKTGKLETPKWWKLQFSFNPRKHVTLVDVLSLGEERFYTQLRDQVEAAPSNDAFVFVHGFNVSFEDAARRTAQIARDLEFRGAPIFFSWPSCAAIKGYAVDEATVDWVLPHLKEFLQNIVNRSRVSTLHLIAHSMGNRALARVLKEIAITGTTLRFNQVLLTAPDIDRGEFLQLAAIIKTVSDRVTLYASSSDKALITSQYWHHYPRAGEAGANIVVTEDVDTIDASQVDTNFMAHSYAFEDRTLLNDIFYLIREGKPPDKRYGLEPKPWPPGLYWAFKR